MFSLRHQNDTICLWGELNMHRPYFEGSFRHNSVMMFGETFHCAALVALDRRFGVNVVLGKANRILGDKLYEFISSVATACDQVSSSQSISVLTTGPPKIRFDRCTSIIAYCIAADPSISERIRDLFISGALRLVKHWLPRDVMLDCFGVDFFKMECPVISLFLRKTPIKNNPEFDTTSLHVQGVIDLASSLGVKTLLLCGDRSAYVPSELQHRHLVIIDLLQYYQSPGFLQLFGEVPFSIPCLLQYWLQDIVFVTLGPHSGGTDHCIFVKSKCIVWTSTDHRAQPRMPRLAAASTDWWKLVPVVETAAISCGFMPEGLRDLTNALRHWLPLQD